MPVGAGRSGAVGTGYVKIKPDADGFGAELEQKVGAEATGASGRMGANASAAFKGAFLAGTALMGKSVFDFAGFDAGMREVFTLMPGITAPAMADMTEQVKAFSEEFGVLPTETIPALYEALGAGVPADNVFAFLEQSQKLAKGGVTDLATAVDGLSTVTNAYGTEVISAQEASDILFKTVGLGKGTVDEVASSLYNVIPTAATFGVTFEDVGAAMAALTAQGVPVASATTSLRQVIGELGKEGTKTSGVFQEMTGKTFAEFIAEGGTLQNALMVLDDAAYETGVSMVDMFGSMEAGSAAAALTKGGGETFFQFTQEMQGAAGSTEAAFETMNTGISATMDKLRARFSVAMIDLGTALAPTVEVVGMFLIGLLEIFSALPEPLRTGIVLFGTLAAGVLAFAGPITKVIALGKQLSGVFSLLAANPWVLVALAIAALAYLIITNWEDVVDFFEDFGRIVVDVWDEVYRATVGWIEDTWDTVSSSFDEIGSFFVDWWPFILGVFTGGIGLVVGLVVQNWDAIVAKTLEITGAVTGAFSSAWNTAYGTVTGVGGQIVSWIVGIPTRIAEAFTTLADIISAPFRAAFAGIKTAWNNTVGGFGFTVPGWIPEVGGKAFNIPSMATGAVVADPMLALVGDAGAGNPEIVTPENLMRQVVTESLEAAPAGGGLVVETHLHVDGATDEARFARMLEQASTEIVRVVQRELDRTRRGAGQPRGAVAA